LYAAIAVIKGVPKTARGHMNRFSKAAEVDNLPRFLNTVIIMQ
jgi:hypothetical protein